MRKSLGLVLCLAIVATMAIAPPARAGTGSYSGEYYVGESLLSPCRYYLDAAVPPGQVTRVQNGGVCLELTGNEQGPASIVIDEATGKNVHAYYRFYVRECFPWGGCDLVQVGSGQFCNNVASMQTVPRSGQPKLLEITIGSFVGGGTRVCFPLGEGTIGNITFNFTTAE